MLFVCVLHIYSNMFKRCIHIPNRRNISKFLVFFFCCLPNIEEGKMKTDVTANIYPISFALFTYNKTFSNFDNNTTKQILYNDGDKQTHTLSIVQNILNNSPFFIYIFVENLITDYVTLYAVAVKTKSFVTELRPSRRFVCSLRNHFQIIQNKIKM